MNKPESNTVVPFDAFLESVRIPVNPAVIDERLHQLWERSAPDSSDNVSYTRLSLANLVVLADKSSQQNAEKLILEFAQERPSRTLLITLESEPASLPDVDEALEAEAAIACSLGDQGRGMLCWERIEIVTPAERMHQIPNVIRALAGGMNQLVLVDLTRQEFSADVDRELSILADYHFFDSRANRRKLSRHLKRSPKKLSGVFDLAYERSHPLREAIKAAFDDPRLKERLPALREITVLLDSESLKQQRRVFAYFAGWLAAKLDLTTVGESKRRRINYTTPTGGELAIRTADKGADGPELQARFCFADPTLETVTIRSAEFLSVPGTGARGFRFEILCNDELHSVFDAPCLSDAGYMLRRLSDVRRRSDYTDTLERTRELLSHNSKESVV